MKVLLTSVLLVVGCLSAVAGISKSLAGREVRGETQPLTIVRNTSDPFVLAASLRQMGAQPVVESR